MSDLIDDIMATPVTAGDLEDLKETGGKEFSLVREVLGENYIEFDKKEIGEKLKPISKKSVSMRDVISRFIVVEFWEDHVVLRSVDGLSVLSVEVACKKTGAMPEYAILDLQTFDALVGAQTKSVFLVHEKGEFFVYFNGGKINVPSARMDRTIFADKTKGEPAETVSISKDAVSSALSSLFRILSDCEIAEINYVFMQGTGIYVTNGAVYSKYEGKFPKVSLKPKDVEVILSCISTQDEDVVVMQKFKGPSGGVLVVKTKSTKYEFPYSEVELSEDFMLKGEEVGKGCLVQLSQLYQIVALFAELPDSTGAVALKIGGSQVNVKFLSKRGVEGEALVIAGTMNGEVGAGTYVVNGKVILTALRAFKGEPVVAVNSAGRRIIISAGSRTVSIPVSG